MKDKKLKITIFALVLTVAFISVGYAAYSTVLSISGTAKINRSVWSVHYDKDSINVLTGNDAGYTLVNPTSTTVDDDNVTFQTELSVNEETSFTVNVVNDGTFTARVSSVNLKIEEKKDTDANYTSLANISSNRWSNDYLDFYVVWTDGSKNILDTVDLDPSTTKNMTIVVRYKTPEDEKLLPSEDMNFRFSMDVLYTQASSLNQNNTVVPKVTEEVSSAADVVNAFQNHGNDNIVLRVNNDIDLTEYTQLPITNNTVIELNGNNVSLAPNSLQISDGGKLTVEDSTGHGSMSTERGVFKVLDGGTLVLNGGTYTTTNNTRGSAIFVDPNAKVVINGGKINAAYYAIGASTGEVDVVINGGELNSTSTSKIGTWAYCVRIDGGRFVMNGGKISGVHGGLALGKTTVAVINNGEIYENETAPGEDDAFYDIYSTENASLKIYNGRFVNNGTRSAIYTDSTGDIDIYNGTFIAKGTKLFTGTKINVTGGAFSHDVTEYLRSGNLVQDGTMYKVGA